MDPDDTQAGTWLEFLVDWQTVQHGHIVQGKRLLIDYDPSRLPSHEIQRNGAILRRLEVFVTFHPGGQRHSRSLLEGINMTLGGGSGPVREYRRKPFTVTVPRDASHVEVWFCSGLKDLIGISWDSRFGENYWFEVIAG